MYMYVWMYVYFCIVQFILLYCTLFANILFYLYGIIMFYNKFTTSLLHVILLWIVPALTAYPVYRYNNHNTPTMSEGEREKRRDKGESEWVSVSTQMP